MAEQPASEGPNCLDDILADFLLRLDRGEPVDREEFITAHSEVADELRSYFANAELLEGAAKSPASETQAWLPGESVLPSPVTIRYFGDYELLEEVGHGGMGVVYKARQQSLNRIVAVKMILAGSLAGPAEVARFRREAEAAANLRHRNIVAIHEVGEYEGHQYFSMDYIEGRSLAELVREGPLPSRKATEYVKTVAEAIH